MRRGAVRLLGGARSCSHAAAAVAACRAMGIQTAADVGACSRTYLVLFDRWLRERGDWMVGLGQSLAGSWTESRRRRAVVAHVMACRRDALPRRAHQRAPREAGDATRGAVQRSSCNEDRTCSSARRWRRQQQQRTEIGGDWPLFFRRWHGKCGDLTHTVQDARSTLMSSRHTFACCAYCSRKCRLVQLVPSFLERLLRCRWIRIDKHLIHTASLTVSVTECLVPYTHCGANSGEHGFLECIISTHDQTPPSKIIFSRRLTSTDRTTPLPNVKRNATVASARTPAGPPPLPAAALAAGWVHGQGQPVILQTEPYTTKTPKPARARVSTRPGVL